MWTRPSTNNTIEKGWWRPSPTPNFIYEWMNTCTLSNIPKQALLCPLFKKVNLDHIFKNYRPVSNLPFIWKLLERKKGSQLVQYTTSTANVEPLQSTYTKDHSTETALLKVKTDIRNAMDNKEVTCLVKLELSAAFNVVNHSLLLNRLQYHFGIQGSALSWIRSYPTSCHWWSWWITGEVN